tara:strand:+ start:69 stop:281 length:213 start_codon:yes stop_codon:yes gene_type:complete
LYGNRSVIIDGKIKPFKYENTETSVGEFEKYVMYWVITKMSILTHILNKAHFFFKITKNKEITITTRTKD